MKISSRKPQPHNMMQSLIDNNADVIESDIKIKQTCKHLINSESKSGKDLQTTKKAMAVVVTKLRTKKCDWQTGAKIHSRTIN